MKTIQKVESLLKKQKAYRDLHGFGWTPCDEPLSNALDRKIAESNFLGFNPQISNITK